MSCKQDKRCPLKLENLPDSACHLAVQRLKALRYAGRELTEEEESKMVGCPWAVQHQLANYCFFKYLEDFVPQDKALSDMEIAHLCSISMDTVKKVEKKSLVKMRESDTFQEITDVYDGDRILDDKDVDIEFETIV